MSDTRSDERKGDVMLSRHPGARTWAEFFEFLENANTTDEFMQERPMNAPPSDRGLFGD